MQNILRPRPLGMGKLRMEFYRESDNLTVLTYAHGKDKDPGVLQLPPSKQTLTATLRAIGPVNFRGVRLEGYFLIPDGDAGIARALGMPCVGMPRMPEICFNIPPRDYKDKDLAARGERERDDFGPPEEAIGKRFKVAFGSHDDGGAIINPAD